MKTSGQVAQKMKQARFRHLKRELENLLKVAPRNCIHNTPIKTHRGYVGVCALDVETCDSEVKDRSKGCSDFEAPRTKEEIKTSLKKFFETGTIPEIAVRFTDVAALLWVLSDEDETFRDPGGWEESDPEKDAEVEDYIRRAGEELKTLRSQRDTLLEVAKRGLHWSDCYSAHYPSSGAKSETEDGWKMLKEIFPDLKVVRAEAPAPAPPAIAPALPAPVKKPWWRFW